MHGADRKDFCLQEFHSAEMQKYASHFQICSESGFKKGCTDWKFTYAFGGGVGGGGGGDRECKAKATSEVHQSKSLIAELTIAQVSDCPNK